MLAMNNSRMSAANMRQATTLWQRVLRAAAAGTAAVWVMDRFDWFVFKHEDQRARQRTESVRPGGMDPAHALAAKSAAAAGRPLRPAPPHRHPAGLAVHYAVPIALAILYDIVKPRLPLRGMAGGASYGACSFLILDEAVSPLLGLAARPDRYPWQRHFRELLTHVIYGTVTDRVLRVLETQLPRAKPVTDAMDTPHVP